MPYALLEEGSSYADWKLACQALSSVTFMLDDSNADLRVLGYGDPAGNELKAFAARFQDIEAELVIASLRSRYEIYREAQDCGVDLETPLSSLPVEACLGPWN
ncbi:hypothetical protein [Sphingobium vermicomposti]|uniref:Uncharacterized protein n=1 Tax=Sphingobium vermicomposti TaxID=529005 RepID=A0A846M8E5_9SPHN|nr:hypothetical protein [Sphingobium vermicomposti]NIJ16374.1 hypothetical protein [Sphingobium vermicomposti]